MRLACCLTVCWLFAFTTATPTADTKPKRATEAKWARGIADDFWEALRSDEAEQAAGLLSPELTKALVTYDLIYSQPAQVSPPIYLTRIIQRYADGMAVTFDSEELAPDRSEATFRGGISGKGGTLFEDKVFREASFTMRVAKESAGKWSIRFLLIKQSKPKP